MHLPVDTAVMLGYVGMVVATVALHAVGTRGLRPELLGVGAAGIVASAVGLARFPRRPLDRMFWWYTHLGNFLGSYIAAWTAFCVVTIALRLGDQGWMVRLGPSMVGVPAIAIVSGYYTRRFAARAVQTG